MQFKSILSVTNFDFYENLLGRVEPNKMEKWARLPAQQELRDVVHLKYKMGYAVQL